MSLYVRALREGHVNSAEAVDVPCVLDFGLLQPAVDDIDRLESATPILALHRLLRSTADRIADERHREERLAALFEPLLRMETPSTTSSTPTIDVLAGLKRINDVITDALSTPSQELLAIQLNLHYDDEVGGAAQAVALSRDQALLDRGGRIHTIYQSTARYQPHVFARLRTTAGRRRSPHAGRGHRPADPRRPDRRLHLRPHAAGPEPRVGDPPPRPDRLLRHRVRPALATGHADVSAGR